MKNLKLKNAYKMTTTEIIKSFKQGGTGNCVSIAVIKASVQVFGVDKVVHFESMSDDEYSFVMKDGFEGKLSNTEIENAKNGSKFSLLTNVEIFNYATLCFAAMAKRALIDENEGAKTFLEAINSLNNGENYHLGAYWLGLRHYRREVGLKYVWSNIDVVGASPKHCFFCSEGIVDDYGIPNKISFMERIKYKFFHYYRIDEEPVY